MSRLGSASVSEVQKSTENAGQRDVGHLERHGIVEEAKQKSQDRAAVEIQMLELITQLWYL